MIPEEASFCEIDSIGLHTFSLLQELFFDAFDAIDLMFSCSKLLFASDTSCLHTFSLFWVLFKKTLNESLR